MAHRVLTIVAPEEGFDLPRITESVPEGAWFYLRRVPSDRISNRKFWDGEGNVLAAAAHRYFAKGEDT